MNIRVNAQTHHSMAIISECLEHDVKFVHAAQKIISQFVRDEYPRVRNLNYVTDCTCQHFKSNRSILNLNHHHQDFDIIACWSFSATAHGKSSVDGIGASIKYRATRHTLSGDRFQAILTPRELYEFASHDTALIVFYLDHHTITTNANEHSLDARWDHRGAKGKLSYFTMYNAHWLTTSGWIRNIRSFHRFDPIRVNAVQCRRTSTSSTTTFFRMSN